MVNKSISYNHQISEEHPNFIRWSKGRETALQRAAFVDKVINQETETENKTILDLGSGVGGTSYYFSKKAQLYSVDLNFMRLRDHLIQEKHYNKVCADGAFLPFKEDFFDIIIIQDVIEHIEQTDHLITELHRVLKKGGLIFLSSPNKFAYVNIISDPHWGLPFLCLLKREQIKKYFLRFFRKQDLNRKDLAQLFSLSGLLKLFKEKYEIRLMSTFLLKEFFKGTEGIIWIKYHIVLRKVIMFLQLHHLHLFMANDKNGILNNLYAPTFYLLLKKK